jgi:hypothetical protein
MIDADVIEVGEQDFIWIGGDSFHGEAGELRFSRGVLAADANGYTKADFEIALTGVNSLNESHDPAAGIAESARRSRHTPGDK